MNKKTKYYTLILIILFILGVGLNQIIKNNNEVKIEQVKVENHEVKKEKLEKKSLDESFDRENGLKVYLIDEKRQKIVWLTMRTSSLKPQPENIFIEEQGEEVVIKVKIQDTGNIFQGRRSHFYKIFVDSEIKKIKVLAE